MRIILNPTHTDDALDHIEELVTRVRARHRKLRQQFVDDRDGYLTQSMGGGGSPENEKDEDGTPLPSRPPDPVGRLVVSRDEADGTVGNALATMVQLIAEARDCLITADGVSARARPPIKVQDPDGIWCENCLEAGVKEPREESRSLCGWCRHEKSERKKLPSPRLVQAHVRGRITPNMRREIEQRDAEDRRAERKKRKANRAA